MQNASKSIIIALASALVAAFFMPWFKIIVSLSAWDMIFGEISKFNESTFKYITILIPVTGLVILYSIVLNNENYLIPKQILFRIPVVTIILIVLSISSKANDFGITFQKSEFESLVKNFGIGFWLTLVASIILSSLQLYNTIEKTKSKQENYSPKSKIGIKVFALGLVLIIVSTQNQFFTKTNQYRADPGARGLPEAYNIMGPIYDTQSYVDTKTKNLFLYSGLIVLVIGGFIFSSGRSTSVLSENKNESVANK